MTCEAIAAQLNQAGYQPPKRCERFTGPIVQNLLQQVQGRARQGWPVQADGPGATEQYLTDLARAIGMPPVTLYHWLRRGWVTGRQEQQAPWRWIIQADANEVARLLELHQRPNGYYTRGRWAEAASLVTTDPHDRTQGAG
jgi:hypothetical protein